MSQQRTVDNSFISLVDIIRILYKNKWLFLILFIIFLLIGSYFIVTKKQSVLYKQQFIMTYYYDGSSYQPVSSIGSIESQLSNYVWPSLINSFNSKHPANEINYAELENSITTDKAIPYVIEFQMKLTDTVKNKQLFDNFSTELFNMARQLEQANVKIFKNQLNNSISVLNQQIPQFKKLQQTELKINELAPTSFKSQNGLQEIRDMYISTLGANSSYMQLYNLLKKLNSQQEMLNSIEGAKQSQVALMPVATLSKLNMLLIILILDLFLSFIATLFVGYAKSAFETSKVT
jgi:hypothetical protein